ncbi:MAG: helix-hairpin-helix domain-containing protein [Bacteroidota bacterium]
MAGNSRLTGMTAIMLGIFLASPLLFSQEKVALTDRAEDMLVQDEGSQINTQCFEELQELGQHPVSLNSASNEELEASGLFTSFQAAMITEYRDTYGDLLSIYELGSVTGFRISRLKEISRFITVEKHPGRIKSRSRERRILLSTGRKFPSAAGYMQQEPGHANPVYTGSPWKNSLKLKTGAGKHLSMGLAYEKDPGEKEFRGGRPEYLAGFVQYRGQRILDQVVLGTYRLRHGMGLIQGSDRFSAPGLLTHQPAHTTSLKPYAGLQETGLHRGMVCRLNLSPVKLTLWSSLQPMDLSVGDLPSEAEEVDWVARMRESGLHRSPNELAGRSLGYLGNAGAMAMVHHKALFTGLQYSAEVSGLTERGRDSLQVDPSPIVKHALGIFWRWQSGNFETFCEYSHGKTQTMAILCGARYHLNDFLSGGLLLHHYGTNHRETFSSAYASGSHINNERGLMLHLHAEPVRSLVAGFSAELFEYPAPRHHIRVPSAGLAYNLTLQGSIPGENSWRIRLNRKVWQITPAGDQTGFRPMVQNNLTRLDGRIGCQPAKRFQWQSRLVITIMDENSSGHGFAALQQARVNQQGKLRCTLQFVVFNIPSWDQRIYLYEPGLFHQFNFPVYHGRGQKLTAVVTLKPGKRVTLECKVSMITYDDRKQTGSGYDLTEGDRRYDTGIQMRLSL